jgi:hypothetical protein
MPRLHNFSSIFFNDLRNPDYFRTSKSAASLQPHWLDPELRNIIFSFNMHMDRFIAVTRIKEDPIWPNSQYSRHLHSLDIFFSPNGLRQRRAAVRRVPAPKGRTGRNGWTEPLRGETSITLINL